MPDDLRALLAAIVADPADDTARLVYADCLQELGNTARAEFIRMQVEAERLHPDSNARARLEEKAQALFAEHWIEWWGEFCAAIGLPRPVAKPSGTIGRLARRIPLLNPPGHPYAVSRFELELRTFNFGFDARVAGLERAILRRGFADTLKAYVPMESPHGNLPSRWTAAAPLSSLHVPSPSPDIERWIDGPQLGGLQSLSLGVCEPDSLIGVLCSRHLSRLQELSLHFPESDNEFSAEQLNEVTRMLEVGFTGSVAAPRFSQLKRLNVPIWSDQITASVASAANLAGLEALEVELFSVPALSYDLVRGEDFDAANARVATLARSPHFAGLRELKVVGGLAATGIEAILRNPTWAGLRKLALEGWPLPLQPDFWNGPGDLPELEELRLLGVSYSIAQVAAFARSPLLKRLRHLAVRGGPPRSVDFDIAHAVDLNRIETFAIGEKELQTGVAAKLQEHFGDRFRLL